MSTSQRTATLNSRPPIGPADYEQFLAKLGTKDRLNVQRHVAACDEEVDSSHGSSYRRLLCILAAFAPHAAKTHGQQAVQYYIPDGKYRLQVFALQDQRDGTMAVYCEDVLEEALAGKFVDGPHEVADVNNSYRIVGTHDSLKIDRLDGKSPSPSPFFKDMLGWNRRALRLTIPANATKEQISAVEKLCWLSAAKWNIAQPV
jgi:hypothetical protein